MLEEVQKKMEQVLALFRQDLTVLKAGRATPVLIEKILVEAYETKMPLVELATITAPEPDQLLIAPFDQTILKNIARALNMDRDLGLSSIVDENVIRVKIPPLTEERRKELVKLLSQKLEAARVMIRQARRDKMVDFKRLFETSEIHEDERRQLAEKLQKLTDEMIEKIEQMGKAKETELMKI